MLKQAAEPVAAGGKREHSRQRAKLSGPAPAVGLLVALALALMFVPTHRAASRGVRTVPAHREATVEPTPVPGRSPLYVGNRAPLLPSALIKLPIGAIQPQGWLQHELRLMADGFPGHLPEVSHWAQFQGNAWVSPTGQGASGWEEVPYWLRGYGDLGFVLGDSRIKADFKRWVDGILSSQESDGYFGPRLNKSNHDLWPNMLALYALRSDYEATGDPRVIPAMLRYFRWTTQIPVAYYLPGSWQKTRGGDNLDSIYWLYNHTGQAWLLDLAQRNHRRTADWTGGLASLHGVDFAQSFREPATYYQQAKDSRFLQATLRDRSRYLGTWGQVPGGMYGADENARPGYTGPRQAAETCAMVESMFSDEILEGITGSASWADHCEDVAFNSLPAATTADLRGLHYLTAPNMVQLDTGSKAPLLQNGGVMLAYDASEPNYRCCQHNVVMGWPYFAEHLWMATPQAGLAAVLYAPSTVTARVGASAPVRIVEQTTYPFDENIHLAISTSRPVKFPLLLRIPGWCSGETVRVNGRQEPLPAGAHGWIRVGRTWRAGDRVDLRLPMPVRLKIWTANKNSVSVYRGPLAYSLRIGERKVRYGGSDRWPALAVYPTTAWNYGLVVDPRHPQGSFTVSRKPGPLAYQPFSEAGTPLEIEARGKRIPAWTQEPDGLVGALQLSPVRSSQPVQPVILIPMGAARLRIAAFPRIGSGPDAREWTAPDRSTTFRYSHLFASDSPLQISSSASPASSSDTSMPRFTWWDHRGTAEWVEYDFAAPRRLRSTAVYWYDDARTGGQCRIPESWQAEWWNGAAWLPVTHPAGPEVKSTGGYGAVIDRLNRVTFDPVSTTRLRLVVHLQKGYSAGILVWHVGRQE